MKATHEIRPARWVRPLSHVPPLLIRSLATLLLLAPSRTMANETLRSPPIVAKIRPVTTSVRAGALAVMEVEMKNVSEATVVVAFENALRSYFFTAESNNGGSFQGSAEGGVRDPKKEGDRCPGDFPTFLLEPRHTLVQLVGVPIPKTLNGAVRLNVVFRVWHVASPPRCYPATAFDLPATVALEVAKTESRKGSTEELDKR